MSLVNISTCPICKNRDVKSYFVVNGYKLIKCNNCQVIITEQATEVNDQEHNRLIYSLGYVKNYLAREKQLSKRFIKILHLIEKYKKGGLLLDIGCGIGVFLKNVHLESVGNWQLFGIEPNKFVAEIARESVRGTIFNGGLPNTHLRSHAYDCVTCLDVIEHSIHLHQNLLEIRRILKLDGIFILQLPNYQSLMAIIAKDKWDWWSPPDHVLHFSLRSITDLLNNHGFEIINRKTYEDTSDFIGNIKTIYKQFFLGKYLFILSFPILFIAKQLAGVCGFGGLTLLVCKVKSS